MFEVKSHEKNSINNPQSLIISLTQKKKNLTENLKEPAYNYKYAMMFTIYKVNLY